MAVDELRQNAMMAHLLDALDRHQDVGHYGRLVFAMVGRFFLSEDELVSWLTKNPGFSDLEARALALEVRSRGYSPPKQARVLQWQARQDFPICPNPEDPNACDVYKDLRFPDQVYDHIEDYYEQLVRDEDDHEQNRAPSPKRRRGGGDHGAGGDHSSDQPPSRSATRIS